MKIDKTNEETAIAKDDGDIEEVLDPAMVALEEERAELERLGRIKEGERMSNSGDSIENIEAEAAKVEESAGISDKEKVKSKKNSKYASYEDIDKDELQRDIEAIKKKVGKVGEEDYQHLLKLERWGRAFTFGGFFLMYVAISLELSVGLSGFAFWLIAGLAAVSMGIGNTARWANVTHPIMHGAYDKVPGIPKHYTKNGYARGWKRYLHWNDWIKPEAWEYEHNIMHHYHLGEDEDPDNVERNMQWLIQSKTPMWLRRVFVYGFSMTWKFTYYAPNTLRILENKERRKRGEPENKDYDLSPFSPNGELLWKEYYLPYAASKFLLIPALFLPLGSTAFFSALLIMILAEAVANFHSFMVIVPNHSAEDIYMFSEPHKSQGEFYLRQIMGSVNYHTGTDLIDFSQGFLNYQIEHHLFPNIPQSYYQKMQPLVKEVCAKHNLEYRQESVFKRALMTVDLMVGKTKLLRVDGI